MQGQQIDNIHATIKKAIVDQGTPMQIQALSTYKKQTVDFSQFPVLKDGKNYYPWLGKIVVNADLFNLTLLAIVV